MFCCHLGNPSLHVKVWLRHMWAWWIVDMIKPSGLRRPVPWQQFQSNVDPSVRQGSTSRRHLNELSAITLLDVHQLAPAFTVARHQAPYTYSKATPPFCHMLHTTGRQTTLKDALERSLPRTDRRCCLSLQVMTVMCWHASGRCSCAQKLRMLTLPPAWRPLGVPSSPWDWHSKCWQSTVASCQALTGGDVGWQL